jgi:uncharacterized membrane protein
MPFWILIAAASYFLSGLAAIFDKFLISKRIPSAASYSFYVGILGVGVLVLTPWGFAFLSLKLTIIALFSGVAFLAALYFFYGALKIDDATRVVPLVGGISPFFILLLSGIFSKQYLLGHELVALLFFVAGGVFLYLPKIFEEDGSFKFRSLLYGVFSAFFFALTFFLSKWVYEHSTLFLTGFIWMRLGSFLAAGLMLAFPKLRHDIWSTSRTTVKSSIYFFLINKAVGASSFVLLNYALFLGPASVIDAMKGLEQIFVFAMAFLFTKFYPDIFKEFYTKEDINGKLAAITSFIIGFMILI